MRTFALLLLVPAWLSAQPDPSSKDDQEIRAVIEARKHDRPGGECNQYSGRPPWIEHEPLAYEVRQIQLWARDRATAEANGVRGDEPSRHYLFTLTRSHGRWTIVARQERCESILRPAWEGQ
jgi:hypothetical protein